MDKYIRVKKIGEGAFGKAILVKSRENGKQCVIKEISLVRMGPKEREDSRKEVAVLSQLNHPNIVTYLESFEERGTLYICMDYCSGGDLYSKINHQRGALIAEEQIWFYFAQICLAVKHIHDRKILHRDIKSQNVFLTGDGRVKIGDFGIAKVLNSTMELARTCIGTPYYLSPELVENKPYNNKSDVWSLGCVLYEMTTLKHAFEAGNMKNLVLKIIRGVYPPIPPKYSYDLRGIIAQLFKRSPRDRPSINALLRKNIMMQKVRSVLSDEKMAEEFSHTIMHGKKIARALPPAPRPASASSRPASASSSRPGSAAKKSVSKPAQSNAKYNPAAIYGAPLVKKSKERPLVDLKKKNNSGGRPIPGHAEWDKKRFDLKEKERQRREIDKQKMAQINKSRESGWRDLVDPVPLPRQEAIRQPVLQKPQMIIPGKVDNRPSVVEAKGNYDQYNAYLDKLQQDRINRIREGGPVPLPRPAAIPYMQAVPEPVGAPRFGREQFQFNRGPQGVDRREAAEAAERVKLAQEFLNRKQEAALNKARGQAEIHGRRPPSGGYQRSATPKQQPTPGAAVHARNREEQDYLGQLRRIREQNMREKKALHANKEGANIDLGKYKPPLDEEKRKKIEALKKQADDWADKQKEESEKAKKDLVAIRKSLEEQAKSRPPSRNAQNRPGSGNKVMNMKPVPAVPITNVLQAIGAADIIQSSPTSEETRQQQKENILKRLNEKQQPNRPKWGDPDTFIPAVTVVQEEIPHSARSQWGEGQRVKLSDLTLEQTSSQMEATSNIDQVIRNPENKIMNVSADGDGAGRQEWGRPGSTLVNALHGLPIIDGTMSSTTSGGSDQPVPTSPTPCVNIVSGIGTTVNISKPSMIREGTITIKSAEESANNKDSLPEAPSLEEQNIEAIITALSIIGELDDKESNQNTEEKQLDLNKIEKESEIIKVQSETEQNLKANDNVIQSKSETYNDSGSNDQSETVSTDDNSSGIKDDSVISFEDKTPRQSVAERLSNNFFKDNSVLTDKPEIPKKTEILFKKPVLLPKPDLSSSEFAKPVIAPIVINCEKEGSLFSKVQFYEDEDDKTKTSKSDVNWDDIKELEGDPCEKMVSKGLTTGNFDIGNVKMLRTCSEPDLSKLFDTSDTSTVTRHASLDRLNTVKEEDLESVKQSLSQLELISPRSDNSQNSDEVKRCNEAAGDDDDEVKRCNEADGDDENDINDDEDDDDDNDDDDDDDIINVRATMQSLLIDDGSDDNVDGGETDIKFNSNECENKNEADDKNNDENEDDANLIGAINDKVKSMSLGKNEDKDKIKTVDNTGNNDVKIEGGEDDENESDSGDDENCDSDDNNSDNEEDDDENDEGGQSPRIKSSQSDSVLSNRSSFNTDNLSELFQGDSDNETTFGDDDDDNDDYDVYGRLEQARAELEEALGFDKFIKVYNAVQALQEDEDEKIEEGTKITLDMLGEENHKLYPQIFQLVMADTAFTEDNA